MRSPITKEGHAQLTAEMEHLKKNERPAIIQAIAEARAHGDLSENAEYHSAKEKQGYIEARIRLLESLLLSADIIDPAAVGGDGRCVFGAFVEIRSEEEQVIKYRLVGEHEADLDKGLLSIKSPIGRSLIGKYAGDVITISTPGGEVEYEVMEVRYQE